MLLSSPCRHLRFCHFIRTFSHLLGDLLSAQVPELQKQLEHNYAETQAQVGALVAECQLSKDNTAEELKQLRTGLKESKRNRRAELASEVDALAAQIVAIQTSVSEAREQTAARELKQAEEHDSVVAELKVELAGLTEQSNATVELLESTAASLTETAETVNGTMRPQLESFEERLKAAQEGATEGDAAVQALLVNLLEDKIKSMTTLLEDNMKQHGESLAAQLKDQEENTDDERRKMYEFMRPIGEQADAMEAGVKQATTSARQALDSGDGLIEQLAGHHKALAASEVRMGELAAKVAAVQAAADSNQTNAAEEAVAGLAMTVETVKGEVGALAEQAALKQQAVDGNSPFAICREQQISGCG